MAWAQGPNTRPSARGYDCRAAAQGRRAPGPADRSPPARLGAQHRGGGRLRQAAHGPGDRAGAGLGRGQKRPHHPTGGLFWPSTYRPLNNGRAADTAQGGRSPRACAAWPCAGPPVSNPPLPRRACGAFTPGRAPLGPGPPPARVGGCEGGPDRRSRGSSGAHGGPGYRSARKGRPRAAPGPRWGEGRGSGGPGAPGWRGGSPPGEGCGGGPRPCGPGPQAVEI